jgi:uncharacterized protein YndB with AHSA1/START domain
MADPRSKIREVTITRIIHAPRELVFKAFTDREMMMQWWGPHGFSNPECEMDVRPNGKWKINMHAPQLGFPNHWCNGVFIEIQKPEKIVFTSRAFLDENDVAGIEGINTIILEEENGKTKLTLHAVLTKLDDDKNFAADGMEQGWSESFEKLNSVVTSV